MLPSGLRGGPWHSTAGWLRPVLLAETSCIPLPVSSMRCQQHHCLASNETELLEKLVPHPGSLSMHRELWYRASLAWRSILESASPAGGTALVVAHNAINQALLCTAVGLPPSSFRRFHQNNGALTVLDFVRGGDGAAGEDTRVLVDRVNQVCDASCACNSPTRLWQVERGCAPRTRPGARMAVLAEGACFTPSLHDLCPAPSLPSCAVPGQPHAAREGGPCARPPTAPPDYGVWRCCRCGSAVLHSTALRQRRGRPSVDWRWHPGAAGVRYAGSSCS